MSKKKKKKKIILHEKEVTFFFVNYVKYLDVMFNRNIAWNIHAGRTKAWVFRTHITLRSLFGTERLSANINLTLHKPLIRFIMNYASPAWKFAADIYPLKLQYLQNNSPRRWQMSKALIDSRFACGFQNSVRVYDFIRKLCRQEAEIIQNHENANFRITVEGERPKTENIIGSNLEAVRCAFLATVLGKADLYKT
jgi:hypothetical protein